MTRPAAGTARFFTRPADLSAGPHTSNSMLSTNRATDMPASTAHCSAMRTASPLSQSGRKPLRSWPVGRDSLGRRGLRRMTGDADFGSDCSMRCLRLRQSDPRHIHPGLGATRANLQAEVQAGSEAISGFLARLVKTRHRSKRNIPGAASHLLVDCGRLPPGSPNDASGRWTPWHLALNPRFPASRCARAADGDARWTSPTFARTPAPLRRNWSRNEAGERLAAVIAIAPPTHRRQGRARRFAVRHVAHALGRTRQRTPV